MTYTLAVCAEMVFTELPLLERIERIHAAGFAAEIWGWADKDATALAATGATFTSMTGYVTGDLITPDGADDLLRTAEKSIPFARAIHCPSLNLHGTGLGDGGIPVRPVEVVTGDMGLAASMGQFLLAAGTAGKRYALPHARIMDRPPTSCHGA